MLDLDHITKLSLEEGGTAMYVYEKELPKISRSKIDGLTKFYGLSSKDAVDYFEIHERTDVRHALIWKSMLQHVPKEKGTRCVNGCYQIITRSEQDFGLCSGQILPKG